IYFTLLVVIPLVFVNVGWGYILTGYLLMHVICGIIISVIFQLAHVVPEMKFPLPDKSGNIEDDWAIHQLNTTSNFAKNNKIVSWFVGGLNHQIEHHLFPNICHIHYRKISDIVKETAKEFNVSYFEIPTLREAIKLHARELKILGQPN
ncbi:MAG: fatty acid desaturase, partial [Bacteroidia bacterium]